MAPASDDPATPSRVKRMSKEFERLRMDRLRADSASEEGAVQPCQVEKQLSLPIEVERSSAGLGLARTSADASRDIVRQLRERRASLRGPSINDEMDPVLRSRSNTLPSPSTLRSETAQNHTIEELLEQRRALMERLLAQRRGWRVEARNSF